MIRKPADCCAFSAYASSGFFPGHWRWAIPSPYISPEEMTQLAVDDLVLFRTILFLSWRQRY